MKTIKLIIISFLAIHFIQAQQLAFPGAEGYGKYSTGGRGGKVVEVTNLKDSGTGSFRDAFAQYPGMPITIVFRVGGIIDLKTPIKVQRSNITIAGQTAPGDGICTKRSMVKIYGTNLIVRYMRFRPGDVSGTNNPAVYGLDIENSNSFIVDHCSMSWSMEEAATFYDNKYSTVQWCVISESLNASYNSKGQHGYAGVWGGQYASYHHNLLAHHHSRAIRFNGSRTHDTLAYLDYRNNVIYNWGISDGCYGNEIEIADTGKPIFPLRVAELNMMNNYYKPGPATSTSKAKILLNTYDIYAAQWASRLVGKVYMSGNYVNGVPTVTANNYLGLKLKYYPASFIDSFKLLAPTVSSPIVMQTAADAYTAVLADAGATFPKRDTVDKRIVKETLTGTASQHATNSTSSYYNSGNLGIIDSQDSVGGWPNYDTTATAPIDTDHDGMPDTWEIGMGLNPNDSADGNNVNSVDGYTWLEEYLNGLVPNSLPLNLLVFNARVNEKQQSVLLDWKTAQEINISHFNIQRSVDGKDFMTIGITMAKGSGEYSFTDKLTSESNQTIYYRLEIIDKDGSKTYSQEKQVTIENKSQRINIFPNPAKNHITININQLNGKVNLVLTDLCGKQIKNQMLHFGNNIIDIAGLGKGTYLASIITNEERKTQKIIIE